MSNLILKADSYKYSHPVQYPPNTTAMFSYVESRGGRYANTLFFGLQYYLKEYLSKPITKEMIDEAQEIITAHGEPFYREGWDYILQKHGGFLPIKIRAVPEGSVIPVNNVLMTVESTDPKCFWIASFVETLLLKVWYPITVSTQSFSIKKLISGFLDKTSDTPEEIDFKLHDFGYRGVSSEESAMIGGMSHLVNFKGTDTIAAIVGSRRYYNSSISGFSIPAAEHSVITAWGKDGEVDAYENMLKQFAAPGKIVAVVSDSYDLWNAVEHIWGEKLKQKIVDSGAIIVIRPDSGNPPEVVLKTLTLLEKKFGSQYNKKSYRVLNNVRVIQGDGINEESIREILETATRAGFSASNIAFGMGGALLQQVNRDTQRFAYKCSEVTVNGRARDVSKSPVTDMSKKSKAGRLDLQMMHGKYETVRYPASYGTLMVDVFENGKILKEYTFDEIRNRSMEAFNAK